MPPGDFVLDRGHIDMSNDGKITFAIPGRRLPTRLTRGGQQKTVLAALSREEGVVTELTAGERSFVKIELVNGPELILRPATARLLFQAQAGADAVQRGEGTASGDATPTNGPIPVPVQLAWPVPASLPRGQGSFEGGVALRAFSVVEETIEAAIDVASAKKETIESKGANLVGKALGEWFDARTPQALRLLQSSRIDERRVASPSNPADNGYLVLIHGTFSSTADSFGKLWTEHADHVRDLFRHFNGHVYGFDHPTLTESPIENALSLVRLLPDGAKLQLLTHSRGGLVAEVLARAASGEPLRDAELELFAEKNSGEVPRLRALYEEVARRGISVTRVVRVACPTRGTLLASKRLDAYLSVLKWSLQLVSIPVAPALVDFLIELAKRREDIETLSGLEAMTPDSALVRWLHASDSAIPGDVRILAGDSQGDSVTSWVKTLLADAFFWTDNDLVVQTRSMYGGAPRKGGALFLLDRSGKASHFGYFVNAVTADGVRNALLADRPRGFASLGPLSAAGLDSSGARGASGFAASPSDPSKPAIVVLPGIMGSHLRVGPDRVWLSHRLFNGLKRLEYGKETGVVTAEQPLGSYYDDLMSYLATDHQVVPFAYDWRAPIENEADRLGLVLDQLLRDRQASNTPVHVVAHSMGGLVVRSVELVLPAVWQRFMAQPAGRLLMLGTPNAGAWAPMQVLSGDHLLGGAISAVGALFDDALARRIFAGLPGFLQLQANLLDYGDSETWRRLSTLDRSVTIKLFWHSLAIQKEADRWGIPSKAVLDRATSLRRRLDEQAKRLKDHRRSVRIVVGTAPSTAVGVDVSERDVSYVDGDGDGTVPLTSALLDGIDAFVADAEHADLTRRRALFPAYVELLSRGTSRLLRPAPSREEALKDAELKRRLVAAASRGSSGTTSTAPSRAAGRIRGFAPETPTDLEQDIFSLSNGFDASDSSSTPAFDIVVTNGNLTFVRQPLMLGHYDSPTLTGAERAMDEVIGKAMTRALSLDDYPQELRSNKVFINTHRLPTTPWSPPRPRAVVVVGMGEEGELRSQQLAASITRAVIAYAQQLDVCCFDGSPARKDNPAGSSSATMGTVEATTSFELAATLLGSGGMGMNVANAALSLAEGVRNANAKLFKQQLPTVSKLHVIELYEDRATEALRSLIAASERSPQAFRVEPALHFGLQPLPRSPDPSYRGADYDLISAVGGATKHQEPTIEFTIDTKRARTEMRSTTKSINLLAAIVAKAEAAGSGSTRFGETLFKLLVPPDMDDFFGNSDSVLLEVDETTAGIPWEVLSSERDAQQKPWAIRAKLLRKRKSTEYRARPVAAGPSAPVLVIGQPKCDDAKYPPLRGAVLEARAVANVFGTEALLDEDAATLIEALLRDSYKIVHIAGHGREDGRGVILSDDTILDSDLVQRLRRVPDLVFVNCCHSAREGISGEISDEERALSRNRPKLASNIAKGLIEIGVRCVVATGWAIQDDAAAEFARVFYQELLTGANFREAVAEARERVWTDFKNGNTWAAYQCYGDPDWRLMIPDPGGSSRVSAEPLLPSPRELIITLEATAHDGLVSQAARARALDKLHTIEQQYGPRWGTRGDVAEAFAGAYSDLGEQGRAIHWYGSSLADEHGRASQRAIEQLLNLRSRVAAEAVADVFSASGRTKAELIAAADTARTEIAPVKATLEQLVTVQTTYERLNLLGSASMRLVTVALWLEAAEPGLGFEAARSEVEGVVDYYRRAEEHAAAAGLDNAHYARLNRMSAELVRDLLKGAEAERGTIDEDVASVRDNLEQESRREPGFFNLAQIEELKIYCAVRARSLHEARGGIERGFEDLFARLRAPRSWSSVRDQARFVLGAYAARATGDESKAANELLQRLEGYAKPSTIGEASGSAP